MQDTNYNLAHCCVALDIDCNKEKGSLFHSAGLIMSQTLNCQKQMPHQDQVQFALENSKDFAKLYEKYQAVASKAEKLLGIRLPYGPKPIKASAREALWRLAVQAPAKDHKAKAAFSKVNHLQSLIQATKRKFMLRP